MTTSPAFISDSSRLIDSLAKGIRPRWQTLSVLQELILDAAGDLTDEMILDTMIKAGRYDWVGLDIKAKNIRAKPELFTTAGSKLFHFDRRMPTSEVEAAIRKDGYEPDPIEKLLAYGAENSDEQLKYPIVALGSSWVNPGGDRGVPCLDVGGELGRSLQLYWGGPGCRWFEDYRFLASGK